MNDPNFDPDNDEYEKDHLCLPLHLLLMRNLLELPVSEEADVFRLLHHYPESMSVKNGDGNTPYGIAMLYEIVDSYFIRVLLHGDTTLDPAVVYNLNYQERRLAIFLTNRAAVKDRNPTI